MTRDDIDTLWQQALHESVAAGEQFTRYRFAALVISRHVKETRVKPTASQLEIFQQLAYQHGGIGDLCGTEFEFAALVAQHEREECAKACINKIQAEIDHALLAAKVREVISGPDHD